MTHRIPIDWDDLEIALTMHMEEVSNYLDLRTGRVELAANELLGNDAGLSEEEVQTGFLKGYLIHIEPLSSSVEYGWMVEFAETVADRRLREKLDVALDGRGAFRRFKDVLAIIPPNASAGLHSMTHACGRQWRSGSPTTTSSPRPRRRERRVEVTRL